MLCAIVNGSRRTIFFHIALIVMFIRESSSDISPSPENTGDGTQRYGLGNVF